VYAALAAANWCGHWKVVPPDVDAGELAGELVQ
jgi:dTMP kinase